MLTWPQLYRTGSMATTNLKWTSLCCHNAQLTALQCSMHNILPWADVCMRETGSCDTIFVLNGFVRQSQAAEMIMPSAGVHVTLPDYYSPEHMGLIVPKTKDGRIVFMLPWQNATVAGTTGV